jgi:hypothetical protein
MKRYATILIIVGLLLASLSFTATVSAVPGIDKRWAIIMCGYLQFQPDCQYMYDMIRRSFDGIYYLTGNYSDPRMSNPYPCKETLSNIAIRDWLAERSDGDDLVFIYIRSHGGGYNASNHVIVGSTWELNSDEGDDICETDVGIDFNGVNGLEDDVWAGVDENIWFENQEEQYWDDDAKEDLDWLAANGKYGKLVFLTQFCHGGGFIKDLSGENRIIISACNETSQSYSKKITEYPLRVHGYFSKPFIDALNLDYGGFDEADVDGDNLMSVLEAYQYAYDHDEARIQGLESPQLDDNGDGVSDSNDGSLASSVYLFQVFTLIVSCSSGGWTLPLFPGTYKFKEGTVVFLSASEGSVVWITAIPDSGYHFVWWAYSASMINFSRVLVIEMDHDYMAYAYFLINKPLHTLSISDSVGGTTYPYAGTYTYGCGASVTAMATPYGYYEFDYWILDGVKVYDNPITVTMDSDHTLKAYFKLGEGGSSGGGEPCPTLFVWNGSDYVDYGVIDIHNSTGEDVIREVLVQTEDVGINNRKVLFRLREGWLGLNFSESVIDQVKLYAINEDGKLKLCPLTSAVHSRLGDVREYVVSSDDYKAQIFLLETIDLTFKVREDSQGFVFVIEGCNMWKM